MPAKSSLGLPGSIITCPCCGKQGPKHPTRAMTIECEKAEQKAKNAARYINIVRPERQAKRHEVSNKFLRMKLRAHA